jgi:hypothetical protein
LGSPVEGVAIVGFDQGRSADSSEASVTDPFPAVPPDGDFFGATSIHRDPEDIVLVRELTLQQLSDWMLQQYEIFRLPERYLKLFRDFDRLKSGLSPIFKEMREGDTIWVAESRLRASLWGHEGIALVRNSRPVVYIRMRNF